MTRALRLCAFLLRWFRSVIILPAFGKEALAIQISETILMKTPHLRLALCFIPLLAAGSLQAAETAPVTWHAQSLAEAIGYMLLFAAIGIAVAILGYKLFDKCTPGNLHKEILENKNIAAAIVAGAVILGVCIIIAAAMLG